MRFISPLRYPGGKGALGHFVGQLISDVRPRPRIYVEPFAGGAGVALRLLLDEYVERVILNDLDVGIASFWKAVLDSTDEFVDLIESVDISVDSWHEQRAVLSSVEGRSAVETGFAMFFLNRTNRSGIIGARPIGGLQQDGKWPIDARFNKAGLIERIRVIARYRNRIEVRQRDALDLLTDIGDAWTEHFVYADPPYLTQGEDLYLDAMTWNQHVQLAEFLRERDGTWLVTYDADERVVSELYPDRRVARFGIAHTAAKQHLGTEYAVFSDGCVVENMVGVGSGTASWV